MHSEGRQIKRRLTPESSLQINLERGTRLGIAEGDWVYLETPKSEGKGA
jgi:anaerobic selenocysteine-containing dehydrogenase